MTSISLDYGFLLRPLQKRYEHGHSLLVLPVRIAEIRDEIALFEVRPDHDPDRPQEVEQEPVRRQIRVGPDQQDHEEVERVANPAIGPCDRKWNWPRISAAQTIEDRPQAERVEEPQGFRTPVKSEEAEE